MNFLMENSSVVSAVAVVLIAAMIGLFVRNLLVSRLTRLAKTTKTEADDTLVKSLRWSMPVWFLLAGLFIASKLVQLPAQASSIFEKALISVLILSITFWAANLGADLLRVVSPAATGGMISPATGVIRYVVKAAVLAVGGLVLLSTLGISVTPILTTIGIGGLALALGLQETLSNLFAGIQVTLAGNIQLGDFIQLESGEQGYVDDVQWRTTRIRTLPNNFVLIPNSRLAQSIVSNYYRPSKDLAVLVDVGVHYSSDLAHVERVTCEVGSKIMKEVAGGVSEFSPFIRYHTFADSSINFTVILRAQQFVDSFLIKHEFIKALSQRYNSEGIVIPFPIRAVNLDQEKAVPQSLVANG